MPVVMPYEDDKYRPGYGVGAAAANGGGGRGEGDTGGPWGPFPREPGHPESPFRYPRRGGVREQPLTPPPGVLLPPQPAQVRCFAACFPALLPLERDVIHQRRRLSSP